MQARAGIATAEYDKVVLSQSDYNVQPIVVLPLCVEIMTSTICVLEFRSLDRKCSGRTACISPYVEQLEQLDVV